jgi:type IV pilus assembly protein PilE
MRLRTHNRPARPCAGHEPRRQAGVTLLELVVTVAIIGILTSIAYPIYQGFVERSRRADAITTLQDIAQQQERWYTQNNAYDDGDNIRVAGAACGNDGCDTEQGFYSIDITVENSGQTFEATATAQGVQANDTDCQTFTVNSLGQRLASGTDCW